MVAQTDGEYSPYDNSKKLPSNPSPADIKKYLSTGTKLLRKRKAWVFQCDDCTAMLWVPMNKCKEMSSKEE